MKKLLAANWKENPKTEVHALKLFKEVAKAERGSAVEIVVFPPFIYLEEIARMFKAMCSKSGFGFGAQDVFWEEKGPYTSEVGPKMLRSLGARYVIIGHSERRWILNETDLMINKKIKLALNDELKVILCVGEPLSIRKRGFGAAKQFVEKQINKDTKGIIVKKGSLTIAYEPIWAIGTGKNDLPEDARAMALFVKSLLKKKYGFIPRFLYGGSVNRKNVMDYVQLREVDGALVGGASLKAAEFNAMIRKVAAAQ